MYLLCTHGDMNTQSDHKQWTANTHFCDLHTYTLTHTHTHTHTHALTQKHTHTCTHTPVFGHSVLTLMPCGRNSSAIPNTHMDMPNLAMVYAEWKREPSRWRRQQHWTRTPWQHYGRGHSGYCITQTYHNGAGTRLLSCWVEDWCSECVHWHFSLSMAGTALSWMWQNKVAQWVWSSEEYDTCTYVHIHFYGHSHKKCTTSVDAHHQIKSKKGHLQCIYSTLTETDCTIQRESAGWYKP